MQPDIIYIVDCREHGSLTGCGAVGSALPWGGRGRGFKSRHSDQMQSALPPKSDTRLSIGFFYTLTNI